MTTPSQKEIFRKFLENIKTQEQLTALLEDIEEATALVYKGGVSDSFGEKIKNHVSGTFSQIILRLDKQEKLPASRRDRSDFFKELRKFLVSVKVVKLTLAFEPGGEFLAELTGWLKRELGEDVAVDITVNEQIIAGCTFQYKGAYRDYSLAAKLDEVLKKEVATL